jgi:hypothetical protein
MSRRAKALRALALLVPNAIKPQSSDSFVARRLGFGLDGPDSCYNLNSTKIRNRRSI